MMLGRHASGLYWMFRLLERAENTSRLVEAGFRMALTRSVSAESEWESVITTAGCRDAFLESYDTFETSAVIEFMMRSADNPASVMTLFDSARRNARQVRTSLTRDVWEAVNEGWMTLRDLLKRPVKIAELPALMRAVRQQSALVRGQLYGTMLQDDIFAYARLGTFVERADNTARLLDVKYYVLLPATSYVGSSLDNVQWETVLRSVSADRSYAWLHGGENSPSEIADFLILDGHMPRSLYYCCCEIVTNLAALEREYGVRQPSHELAAEQQARLNRMTIDDVFAAGLHEFITDFLARNNALGRQIETDYRFYE
jgi:uncharacterized alpha-E superfamily protein